MTKFADKVQIKYSKGWRKEAQHLGQLWDVIRNFTTVHSNVPIIVTRWKTGEDIEMETTSFIYRLRTDRNNVQIGDMIVGKDTANNLEQDATKERYTVVSERLLRDNIGVRTDLSCTVFRPTQTANFGNASNPYSMQTVNQNSLQLAFNPNTNLWGFVPQPAASPLITTIYAGVTFGRLRDYENPMPMPLTTKPTGWVVTIGQLPGVHLQEDDMIVDPDGNWYRVDRPYYQIEGAFVNQLHATRVRV